MFPDVAYIATSVLTWSLALLRRDVNPYVVLPSAYVVHVGSYVSWRSLHLRLLNVRVMLVNFALFVCSVVCFVSQYAIRFPSTVTRLTVHRRLRVQLSCSKPQIYTITIQKSEQADQKNKCFFWKIKKKKKNKSIQNHPRICLQSSKTSKTTI